MKEVIHFSAALMRHFEETGNKEICGEIAYFTYNYIGPGKFEEMEDEVKE